MKKSLGTTRYIPAQSEALAQYPPHKGGFLLSLTIGAVTVSATLIGILWLKDFGGSSWLADMVEHASGTYDWIHNPGSIGKFSDAYNWHKMFPEGVDKHSDNIGKWSDAYTWQSISPQGGGK